MMKIHSQFEREVTVKGRTFTITGQYRDWNPLEDNKDSDTEPILAIWRVAVEYNGYTLRTHGRTRAEAIRKLKIRAKWYIRNRP